MAVRERYARLVGRDGDEWDIIRSFDELDAVDVARTGMELLARVDDGRMVAYAVDRALERLDDVAPLEPDIRALWEARPVEAAVALQGLASQPLLVELCRAALLAADAGDARLAGALELAAKAPSAGDELIPAIVWRVRG